MAYLKRGRVIEERGSQARVQFEDSDGMPSCWLDCGQQSTKGKKSFRRFRKGELVRCVVDDKGETGEVMYAMHHDGNIAPRDASDVFYQESADGGILEMGVGFFRYTSAAGAVIEAEGANITLRSPNITIDGDLTVTGNTDLKNTKINGVTQSGS